MSVLERTDHDRATFAPMPLTLGGEIRPVRPLPIKLSRPWKKKLRETISGLASLADLEFLRPDPNKPEDEKAKRLDWDAVQKAIAAFLEEAPDQAAEIVFAYVKAADASLDRAWFDEHVTDEEVAEALPAMIEVTVFPLVRKLGPLASIAQSLR